MRSIRRWLGIAFCALVPGVALADSVVTALALAPSADCGSRADVDWSFTYSVYPNLEYFTITTATATIGGQSQLPAFPNTGSFTGTFIAPIQVPQPPNTLIGTYGAEGDNPPNVNTAEFFILYNCTTKQVLYRCSGNNGRCPRTAAAALDAINSRVPVDSPLALVVTMLAIGAVGAVLAGRAARRCT